MANTATINLYKDKVLIKTQTVVRPETEPNFVNCVGRFIYQNKIDSNHLIQKWHPASSLIELFITEGNSHNEGECF